MKLKKITSAIAAMAMTAAMGVSAMSASAIEIGNTSPTVYGGFCALWEDTNGDGVVNSNDEYTPAPHGMYDGEIYSATYNSTTGKYDLVLQAIPGYGSLIGITTTQLLRSDYGTDAEYLAAIDAINMIEDDEVSLSANTTYYYYASTHHSGSAFQFKVYSTESSRSSY